MSRSVDATATLGSVRVKDTQTENGEVVAVEIEGTIGGVHGNRLTVSADWWRENTPDPTPGLEA